MRAALISINNQPRDDLRQAPLAIVGLSLARRQLEFALAAGCERIIVLGDGADPEAIALRHAAEGAGARFQAIADAGALLGTVRATEELLVIAPGVLPESRAALEAVSSGPCVLVLPAEQAIIAGFERIDLDRAWAGALVVPGSQVERLSQLPPDSDAQAALLRIALQAQVREDRLPDSDLAEGRWTMPRDPIEAEASWLRRNVAPPSPYWLTGLLAHQALMGFAGKLLKPDRSLRIVAGSAIFVMWLALAAAWFAMPALGFFLLAVGGFLAALCGRIERLRGAPFGLKNITEFTEKYMPLLVDLALLGTAVAALAGTWPQRIFPPLVLLAALHATRLDQRKDIAALLADRGLLAILLTFAAAFSLAEPAIMLLALAILLLKAAPIKELRS